jgi:hypothetical protein
LFPEEHTSYTAAAVLLVVDGITQTTQASDLFAPQRLKSRTHTWHSDRLR